MYRRGHCAAVGPCFRAALLPLCARLGGCTAQDTSFCREVDAACETGVPLDEPMAIIVRAYLERKPRVGAAYGEIVLDRILKFAPKAP